MNNLDKALNDLRNAFMEMVKPLATWLLDRPWVIVLYVAILLLLMAIDIL